MNCEKMVELIRTGLDPLQIMHSMVNTLSDFFFNNIFKAIWQIETMLNYGILKLNKMKYSSISL